MFQKITPKQLERQLNRFLPWTLAISIITAAIGVYWGLFLSPQDYLQGDYVRIMYVHVPCAWMALMMYTAIAALSGIGLVWRSMPAYLLARSCAPVGALFTTLCLITGSIWGHPTWGTWWEWDARLTTVLILWFIYIGYIGLGQALGYSERSFKNTAILALIGFVNIPLIKGSVTWWNSLHQGASFKPFSAPSVHTSMRWPLILMAVAALTYAFCMVTLRFRKIRAQRHIEVARLLSQQEAFS